MTDKAIKKPSIKTNAIFNVLRKLMTLIFPLITFPYSSRILLPEGIGKVSFARSFIEYFITIATLGIYTYGIRETAKVRDDRIQLSKVSKEILTINMVSTCIAYLLLFIAMLSIPKLAYYRSLLIIISAKILFSALGLEWLYGGMEDYKYITGRAFVFQIISVILLFAFVHKPEDYLIYASIAVISNVGSHVCNWIHSGKYIDLFIRTKLELKRHLKPIFTMFAMAEVSKIYLVLDVTMLGFLCGDWDVGIYTSATKINRIVLHMITAIGVVVIPRLAYYIKKDDKAKFQELVYKNFDMFFLLSIPSAIGLCLVGKAAILAFSGEKFMAAVPVMRIMNPIIVITGIGSVVGTQTFIPMGKEKLVLYALLIGSVCNIALNFILIPRYHAGGAAVATLISQCVLSGTEFFWCRKIVDLRKVARYFLLYLGNSLVMAVGVFVCVKLVPGLWTNTIVAICVGMAIYGVLLFIEKNRFVMDFIKVLKRRINYEHRAD